MTAAGNGTPEPENDDPFAYLYRGEGDEAASAADRSNATGARNASFEGGGGRRAGVPRTSYNQVTRVGERRQAPQQSGYGYPPPPQTQAQPQQQYAAAPPAHRGGHGGGRGSGSNRRGLMLGAIAVVVVVAVGIGVAALTGSDKSDNQAGANTSPAPSTSQGSQGPSPSASSDPNAKLPQEFAATLTLSGGAKTDNNHQGAKGPNGAFVDGMETPGATVTWNATVPKTGTYALWVRYANAQPDDAKSTVVVNGKPLSYKINLKNYGTAGNWDLWYTSWMSVNLNQGANTIALTCAPGDVCHYNLDRVGVTVDQNAKPEGW
ncbi:CBM35 domain-containing protein [Streptomyces silvisoli]|uniref:CBM35 domain-containing protein n=1 Tax=Streptomyces silvisoli TaxID=3034235 RepID=A0ABT5ZSM9_9ACTN|nr:CBM35 domain-containing protein [Streptomyces silvisoli]MDF3292834.1 CBM35 domain-containing protein [Streptomyces silvisoli]